MGVRGAAPGDLRENEERAFCAAEMLRESLGLAARAAYIMYSGNGGELSRNGGVRLWRIGIKWRRMR